MPLTLYTVLDSDTVYAFATLTEAETHRQAMEQDGESAAIYEWHHPCPDAAAIVAMVNCIGSGIGYARAKEAGWQIERTGGIDRT